MENGYRHEVGKFAPETAVGTGASEPLVDEVEAATAVPTVDESVLGTGGSQNKPRQNESTVDYSGEKVAEPTSDEVSNGEDAETRGGENEAVVDGGDPDVNKLASEVRPEVPQKTRKQRREEAEA